MATSEMSSNQGESQEKTQGKELATPAALSMDHVCSATRLLEKRREMFEAQERLERQEEIYAKKEEEFRVREERLRKHDQDLQKKLVELKGVLTEKEAKIERANKRYESEMKQREAKEQEIVQLKLNLKKDQENVAKLGALADRRRKYQLYLEKVVEHVSEDYTEISEILSRYRTLKDVHDDLKRSSKSLEETTDKTRLEFRQYTKEKMTDILNYSNKLSTMQKDIDVSEAARMGVQTEVSAAMRAKRDKKINIGQILMAVTNLRERCTAKHGRIIMHYVPSKKEEPQDAKGGGSDQSGGEAGDKEKPRSQVRSMMSDKETIAAKVARASDDLVAVLGYIRDFEHIVRNCPKEKSRSE